MGKYDKIQIKPSISLYFGYGTPENNTDEDNVVDYLLSEEETEVFGLMNTQIQIPISISFKDIDIELSYIYNIPRELSSTDNTSNSGAFKIRLVIFLVFFNLQIIRAYL